MSEAPAVQETKEVIYSEEYFSSSTGKFVIMRTPVDGNGPALFVGKVQTVENPSRTVYFDIEAASLLKAFEKFEVVMKEAEQIVSQALLASCESVPPPAPSPAEAPAEEKSDGV